MIGFFEVVVPVLGKSLFAFLGFVFLSFCFVLFLAFSGKRDYLKFFVVVLVVSVSLLLFSIFVMRLAVWQLQGQIESMAEDASIYIDGGKVAVPEGQCLRSALSAISETNKMSGSHPTRSHALVVEGEGESFRFIMRRDSRESSLYWVFYPNYKTNATIGWVGLDGCDLLLNEYLDASESGDEGRG